MDHFIQHLMFKVMLKVKFINKKTKLRCIIFLFLFQVWSANDEFDVVTSLISRSAAIQCQAFHTNEPLLYLGTSISTIKVLHITEKRIIHEAMIDKDYPRVMYMYPHTSESKHCFS